MKFGDIAEYEKALGHKVSDLTFYRPDWFPQIRVVSVCFKAHGATQNFKYADCGKMEDLQFQRFALHQFSLMAKRLQNAEQS